MITIAILLFQLFFIIVSIRFDRIFEMAWNGIGLTIPNGKNQMINKNKKKCAFWLKEMLFSTETHS